MDWPGEKRLSVLRDLEGGTSAMCFGLARLSGAGSKVWFLEDVSWEDGCGCGGFAKLGGRGESEDEGWRGRCDRKCG